MNRLIKIFILISAFALIPKSIFSQELTATVSVNVEQLSSDKRTDIATLQEEIKSYINNQQYLNMEWQGEKIPVDINIFLTGKNGSTYSAKMSFVSQRKIGFKSGQGYSVMMKTFEQDWSFQYSLGARLTHQSSRWDDLSSMLDFYALLAIGFDLDSYGELDGTVAFEAAKTIAINASSGDVPGFKRFYQPGEASKMALINDITDMRNEDFRKLMFSFSADGLDSMTINKDIGLKNIENVIARMADFKNSKVTGPNELIQLFFDTKYMEIADMFNAYPSKDFFKNLRYLDPSHSTHYYESENGSRGR